jgi:hypothetical protein
MLSNGRELWQWTQIGWGPSHGPNGGVVRNPLDAPPIYNGRNAEFLRIAVMKLLYWVLEDPELMARRRGARSR